MAIKYFTLNPVVCIVGERNMKKFRNEMKTDRRKSFRHESHLNVTSLSSGLLTNLGSIRDPFTGCRTVSLMGFIGSQPKHVLKISANSNVVPSFCKHDTNNKKRISAWVKKKVFKSRNEFFPLSPSPFVVFSMFYDIKI
jgi:hypothetical protein